jgi:cytochrome P450
MIAFVYDVGYKVKKGTPVIVPMYLIHRDPRLWAQDSDSFHPERWLNETTKNVSAWQYLPFSSGLRNCVGRNFNQPNKRFCADLFFVSFHDLIYIHSNLGLRLAQMEGVILLSMLTQKFDFSHLDPSYTLETTFSIVQKPVKPIILHVSMM